MASGACGKYGKVLKSTEKYRKTLKLVNLNTLAYYSTCSTSSMFISSLNTSCTFHCILDSKEQYKQAPSRGGSGPHLTLDSLGHFEPHSKWHHDRFRRFRTGDRRVSLYFAVGPLSPRITLFHGGSGIPPTTFLGPIWTHNPNDISISSAILAQMTAECPYTLQWFVHFPRQNCRFPCGMWTWGMVPWAHLSPQPQRHLDRFSRICRAD